MQRSLYVDLGQRKAAIIPQEQKLVAEGEDNRDNSGAQALGTHIGQYIRQEHWLPLDDGERCSPLQDL